jgi:hypothetical protein
MGGAKKESANIYQIRQRGKHQS